MTPINDSIREDLANSLAFYEANYEVAGQWFLEAGNKTILKRQDGKRICRFCGQQESPTVTFRKDAHAVPESLGNKSLFSDYECDTCNENFGCTIENDFGNWSKPMRTLMRISGKKNKIPTLRKSKDGGWRIEYKENQLEINNFEGDPIYTVDEKNNLIRFSLRRDAYKPVGVLKTFFKMALTLMPEQDIPHYLHALAWLKMPYSLASKTTVPVMRSFVPGPLPNDKIALLLLRRKDDSAPVPYMIFIFMYANEMYQVLLASATKDAHLEKQQLNIPYHPTPYDLFASWPYGPTQRGPLDLSGAESIRGETFDLTMSFDSKIERDTPKSV